MDESFVYIAHVNIKSEKGLFRIENTADIIREAVELALCEHYDIDRYEDIEVECPLIEEV